MTQSTPHAETTTSGLDPEIAALSDAEFNAHLYAQGIRFGEVRPTRIVTERQRRRAWRRLTKLIRDLD